MVGTTSNILDEQRSTQNELMLSVLVFCIPATMALMDTVNNNNGSRTVTTLIIQSGVRIQ